MGSKNRGKLTAHNGGGATAGGGATMTGGMGDGTAGGESTSIFSNFIS